MIHRYWTGPTSPPMEPWLRTVLERLNPDEEIKDWTDDTLPFKVENAPSFRQKANLVRLLLLQEFGGAWYDYDLIPLLPVAILPPVAVAAHVGMCCNCFMKFPAGHPLLKAAIDYIRNEGWPEKFIPCGEWLVDKLSHYHRDVAKLLVPLDVNGQRNKGAQLWAVHTHHSQGQKTCTEGETR